MADDIDIEEHDLLDNPAIKKLFPDITVLKTEIIQFDEEIDPCCDLPEASNQLSLCAPIEQLSIENEANIYQWISTDDIGYRNDNLSNGNIPTKIILGSKPNFYPDYDSFEEKVSLKNLEVKLTDLNSYLSTSQRYCKTCCTLFATPVALELHERKLHPEKIKNTELENTHSKGNNIKCSKCDVSFTDLLSFKSHCHTVHNKHSRTFDNTKINNTKTEIKGKTDLRCLKCKITFENKCIYQKHYTKYHTSIGRPNSINDMITQVRRNLLSLKTSGVNASNKCYHCNASFSTPKALIEHLYSILQSNKYKCKLCPYNAISKDEYAAHMIVHDKECKIILTNVDYGVKDVINNPIDIAKSSIEQSTDANAANTNENEETYFRCILCLFYFPKYDVYVKHLHTKHNIKRNERMLNFIKPVAFDPQCPHCEKYFYNIKGFHLHLMVVHKDVLISQGIIQRGATKSDDNFSKPDNASTSHLDSKWGYRCHICSCQYFFRISLKHHLSKFHNIEDSNSFPRSKLQSKCPYCMLCYSSTKQYNWHIRNDHRGIIDGTVDQHEQSFNDEVSTEHIGNSSINQFPEKLSSELEKSNSKLSLDNVVLKRGIFKCMKCDVHFISSKLAVNHLEHIEMLVNWKCNDCERIFKVEDKALHEGQHINCNIFTVYDICPTTPSHVLYKCSICAVHFEEERFKKHYFVCENETPDSHYCITCDILVDECIIEDHESNHSRYTNPAGLVLVDSEFYPNIIHSDVKYNQGPVIPQKIKVQIENKDKESDATTSDLTSTVFNGDFYYCTSCKCFLIKNQRNHQYRLKKHRTRRCDKINSICTVCGLRVQSIFYENELHKQFHKHNLDNLQSYRFYDLHNERLAEPPLPEYPMCWKCQVHFTSHADVLKHDCNKLDYHICEHCNIKLSAPAFSLHVNFHKCSAGNNNKSTSRNRLDKEKETETQISTKERNSFFDSDSTYDELSSTCIEEADNVTSTKGNQEADLQGNVRDVPAQKVNIVNKLKRRIMTGIVEKVSLPEECNAQNLIKKDVTVKNIQNFKDIDKMVDSAPVFKNKSSTECNQNEKTLKIEKTKTEINTSDYSLPGDSNTQNITKKSAKKCLASQAKLMLFELGTTFNSKNMNEESSELARQECNLHEKNILSNDSENNVNSLSVKNSIMLFDYVYCHFCKVFLNARQDIGGHYQQACLTTETSTRVCKVCGLLLTKDVYDKHKHFHETTKESNLNHFNFYDLTRTKLTVPPIPEYPKCSTCQVHFISNYKSFDHNSHCDTVCHTCKICKIKLNKDAYKLHMSFHHFHKSTNNINEKESPKVENKSNMVFYKAAEKSDNRQSLSECTASENNEKKLNIKKSHGNNIKITKIPKHEKSVMLFDYIYCHFCKVFLNSRQDIEKHYQKVCLTKATKSKVCKVCGLTLTPYVYLKHKQFHETTEKSNLNYFNFYDLTWKKMRVPPIPEYPKCSTCQIHFTSIDHYHGCDMSYRSCDICKIKLGKDAFKLHMTFHHFHKSYNYFNTNESPKVQNETSMDFYKIAEQSAEINKESSGCIIYCCDECNVGVNTYDKVIEHCQNHYTSRGTAEIETSYCRICNVKFDKKCYALHQDLHTSHNRDFFNVLNFDTCYFIADNETWIDHVFSKLPADARNKILSQSIYKTECRIKMKVVQDGPADLTVYRCDTCKNYIDSSTIYRHAENSCFTVRKYLCSVCGIPFISSIARLDHEQVHLRPNVGLKSYRIVVFNKQEDKDLNKLLYVRSQNYCVLYQCRSCSVIVDKSASRKHICDKSNTKVCLMCDQLIRLCDYDRHVKRHQNIPIFAKKNMKIILFGECAEENIIVSNSLSGNVYDYTLYCCSKCDLCVNTATSKHTCYFGASRVQCVSCELSFPNLNKLKYHSKLHDFLPDFHRENMRIKHFDPQERNETENTDSGKESCITESLSHDIINLDVINNVIPTPVTNEEDKTKVLVNSEGGGKEKRIVESNIKMYKCTCGLHFLDEISVLSHFPVCNPKIRSVKQKCSKCDLLFSPNVLFNHMLMHHADKTKAFEFAVVDFATENILYQCSKCAVHFIKNRDVLKHFNTCEGVPSGKICEVCHLKFETVSLVWHGCGIDKSTEGEFEIIRVGAKTSM